MCPYLLVKGSGLMFCFYIKSHRIFALENKFDS